MARPRVEPREFNSIASAQELLSRWSGRVASHKKRFSASKAGNINFGGVIAGTFSHIFTPCDAEFEASIEPGVRPIVLAIIRSGLVTYTSCEGHRYACALPVSECHVGVLPRTRTELRRAWRAFRAVHHRTETSLEVSSLVIFPWYLADETSRTRIPIIDLYLRRKGEVCESEYHGNLRGDAIKVAHALQVEFGA